jgi:hypothetical protein
MYVRGWQYFRGRILAYWVVEQLIQTYVKRWYFKGRILAYWVVEMVMILSMNMENETL